MFTHQSRHADGSEDSRIELSYKVVDREGMSGDYLGLQANKINFC
jgi:hypothetical protein